MTDHAFVRIAAAAPLAVAGLLILLNPIYDKYIESGAEREFGDALYLGPGGEHTPLPLLIKYTSWALDVAQAGALVLIPFAGFVATFSGNTSGLVGYIDLAFTFVGFVIFACTAIIKHPVQYAKKYGFRRGSELRFGWTRVSIIAMILYLGAAVVAYFIA